jgi:hypothetical protein
MEMFNVSIYVTFMLQEAFSQVKVRHDEMQRHWSRMTVDLEAAKALRDAERLSRIRLEDELQNQKDAAEMVQEEMQTTITELERSKNVRTSSVIVT